MFTTNLQIHIVTCCIHLHIHHTSRTPYLFHSFSDFVVYVVTTLIFPKNQRQCAEKISGPNRSIKITDHFTCKNLSSKSAPSIPTESTSAFHSTNLFLFSRQHIPTNSVAPLSAYKPTYKHIPTNIQHIPTNSVAPLSAYKPTHNPQFLPSL